MIRPAKVFNVLWGRYRYSPQWGNAANRDIVCMLVFDLQRDIQVFGHGIHGPVYVAQLDSHVGKVFLKCAKVAVQVSCCKRRRARDL